MQRKGKVAMFIYVILPLGVMALIACLPSERKTSISRSAVAHDDAILIWARKQHGDSAHAQTFFGDFTGDGTDDALAWILYPSGGNSEFLDVALFRNERDQMTYYRSIDNVFGSDPRNILFEQGRITITTTMPNPGDPRCCSTGYQNWVIDTK